MEIPAIGCTVKSAKSRALRYLLDQTHFDINQRSTIAASKFCQKSLKMHVVSTILLMSMVFIVVSHIINGVKLYLPKGIAQFPLRCNRSTMLHSLFFDGKNLSGTLLVWNRSLFYRQVPFLELRLSYDSITKKEPIKIEVTAITRRIPRRLENNSFIRTKPIPIEFQASMRLPSNCGTANVELKATWTDEMQQYSERSKAQLNIQPKSTFGYEAQPMPLQDDENVALYDVTLTPTQFEGIIVVRNVAVQHSECSVLVDFSSQGLTQTITATFNKPISHFYNQYTFQIPVELFKDAGQLYISSIRYCYSAFGIPVQYFDSNNGKGYWFVVSVKEDFENIKYLHYAQKAGSNEDLVEFESPYLYNKYGLDVLNLGELLRQKKIAEDAELRAKESAEKKKLQEKNSDLFEKTGNSFLEQRPKRVQLPMNIPEENNDRKHKHTNAKRNTGSVVLLKNYNLLLKLINDTQLSFYEKFYCCYRLSKSLGLFKKAETLSLDIICAAINLLTPHKLSKADLQSLMLDIFYVYLLKIPLLKKGPPPVVHSLADLKQQCNALIPNTPLNFGRVEERIQILEGFFYRLCSKIELVYLACKFTSTSKPIENSLMTTSFDAEEDYYSLDSSKSSLKNISNCSTSKKIVSLNDLVEGETAEEFFMREQGTFASLSSNEIADFLQSIPTDGSDISLHKLFTKEFVNEFITPNSQEMVLLHSMASFIAKKQYACIYASITLQHGAKADELRRMIDWRPCNESVCDDLATFCAHIVQHITILAETLTQEQKQKERLASTYKEFFVNIIRTVFGSQLKYSAQEGMDGFKNIESVVRFTLSLMEVVQLPASEFELVKSFLDQ